MDEKLADQELLHLSAFIETVMGLDFPQTRWPDLQRGIAAAAQQLGFNSLSEYARQIVSGPATQSQLQALASHLTVGETYFFRDAGAFRILAERIIPSLIRERQNTFRSLRIWSAACCTGEEPYSIAVLLRQTVPDFQNWNIKILATDINPRFLRKAKKGVFGKWSFREAPDWLQHQYFRSVSNDQFEISPAIRQMVSFAPLNLVSDCYPIGTANADAVDIIFCRNVLMYFSAAQARKVIEKLYASQAEGGWLVIGPGELPLTSCSPYVPVNVNGTTVYHRDAVMKPDHPAIVPQHIDTIIAQTIPRQKIEPEQPEPLDPIEPEALQLLARSLANEGKLADALDCCDRWIAVDSFNSSGHYLRAVILQEQGAIDRAAKSLRGAIYLNPKFVLAHFALGRIARTRGEIADAEKHLENARKLLRGCRPEDVLPESDGVTAARFTQIVDSLIEMEEVA